MRILASYRIIIYQMDILKTLHSIPLFSGLEMKSLGRLTPLFDKEFFAEGSKILREGEFGDSVYLIADGKVSVTKYSEILDKEVFITHLNKGSYFGEVSLIDNQPRSASIISDEDTTVLRLRKSVFEKLLLEDKTFAINFYRNCLNETLVRMRETATNLTSSKTDLDQKSTRLNIIDEELSNARLIQDYFVGQDQLSSSCFEKHNIRQSHIYNPYLEVGGDFINLKSYSDDKIGFMIADVMGHGISAALATGVLRSGFSIFSKTYGEKPVELMSHLNEHIYEIFTSLFATGYYALIDMQKAEVSLCKGGHMHPLVWKAKQGNLLPIDLPGPGLGIIRKANFEELIIQLEKGDKMLFFTDGIIEQRNGEGEMFTQERLTSLFNKYCLSEEEKIVKQIYADFQDFCQGMELQDDVTLFLLEF